MTLDRLSILSAFFDLRYFQPTLLHKLRSIPMNFKSRRLQKKKNYQRKGTVKGKGGQFSKKT
jgi:hypothetical protein